MHNAAMNLQKLQDTFGSIDIYLFDQLLKGRITSEMKILDAGCGGGRNLVYFFRNSYEVFGVDESSNSIKAIRGLAASYSPQSPPENFRVEPIEAMTFAADSFDYVICSAVLHFARDESHWQAMLRGLWRVLRPGGTLFVRTASEVGLDGQLRKIEGRRFHLPDGSDRFLVDDSMLLTATESLDGELVEPLKTVVVHGMRSMSTWVVKKRIEQR